MSAAVDTFLETIRSAALQARGLCAMPEQKANRLAIARASEMLSEIECSARRLSQSDSLSHHGTAAGSRMVRSHATKSGLSVKR